MPFGGISEVKPKDIERAEKVTTNDNFSENDEDTEETDETPAPAPPPDNLHDYVMANSEVLCVIFDIYLGISDNDMEREVITNIKNFIQVIGGKK